MRDESVGVGMRSVVVTEPVQVDAMAGEYVRQARGANVPINVSEGWWMLVWWGEVCVWAVGEWAGGR